MVNKDGQTKTRLPTQYRSNNKKNKILKKEGNKENYQITKCFLCSARKMKVYTEVREEGKKYKVKECTECKFANYVPIY